MCKFGNSAGNCVQDALTGDGVLRSISVLLTRISTGHAACCWPSCCVSRTSCGFSLARN